MADIDAAAVWLDFRGPYPIGPAMAVIGAHAVPGGEVVGAAGHTHTRLIRCAGEPVATRVSFTPDRVELAVSDAAALVPITALVRRWLDLDTDVEAVDVAWAGTPWSGRRSRPSRACG